MTKTVWTVVALSLAVPLLRAEPPPAGALRSFYVASPAGFGLWTWEIVSVEPVGQDVRVRVMRVQSASDTCPEILVVQAAERIVPRTAVQDVAGVHICDVSQQAVDRAHTRARTPSVHYVDYLGSVETVVADCGGRPQTLVLSDQGGGPWINFTTLKRRTPVVAALWRLGSRLSAGMLPGGSYTPAPALEALGTSLLPELRSEKYAPAFDDHLEKALKGYTGPPARRDPLPAEVIERDALPLLAFVAPPIPLIAQSARITGDVRLRLTVDATTGDVSQISRLIDKPILGDAAVAAVRTWRFDPARAPREPVDVTIRFALRCRED